jgi:hypothetical protein
LLEQAVNNKPKEMRVDKNRVFDIVF